jgi:hypothetical protein
MRRVVFKLRFLSFVVFAMVAGVWPMAAQAAAATAPDLKSAASFGVLAGTTVTNTGLTVITGDLGVSPGTAWTGFPPGTVIGTMHSADAVALQAQTDLTAAYTAAVAATPTVTLTGQDLGGKTLTQGVYFFASSAQLTGQLTLDFQGNPNAVFIFQIVSTLTTASGSSVRLINYTKACSVAGGGLATPLVFWQVGSSATLGTTTAFAGTIMALTSITMTTGATLNGRALARNGAVTLDSNTINTCGSNPNPVACKQGSGKDTKDTDENAEQSKDTEDSHKSGDSATFGASLSSKDDSKSENGKQDRDEGNKGCNSDNSNHGDNKQSKDS